LVYYRRGDSSMGGTGFAVVQMGYKLRDTKKCVFHRKEGRWQQDGLPFSVGCQLGSFVAGSCRS
jgi:hypothetical protein